MLKKQTVDVVITLYYYGCIMLDINSYNASKILQTIWQAETVSRIAIAEQLDLNKSTITKILTPLIEDGIVVSRDKQASGSRGGRKAEVLSINEKYGNIMGIEIQTDRVVLCVTDLTGKIIFTDSFDFSDGSEDILELIKSVVGKCHSLCKRREISVLGAALGVAGVINPYNGMVYQSNPLNVYSPVTLYGRLDDAGFPVLIENDANCCCSREMVQSRTDRKRNFICVLGEFRKSRRDALETSGIAIGLGVALKGSILHGDNFSAGEFQSLYKSQPNPTQFDISPEELENLEKDEALLNRVLRELARNLSLLVNTLNITCIYFEGNIVRLEEQMRPILRDEIQRNWPYDSQVDCQFIFSDQGVSAVAHGAACMFLEKLFSPQRFWESFDEYYPSGIEFINKLKELQEV